MNRLYSQPKPRLLVTLWTLLWMVVAAPCAMAGGAGEHGLNALADGPVAEHPSPEGHPGDTADLLCLQDCNQLAIGKAIQGGTDTAPVEGLAEPLGEIFLLPSLALRASAAPNGGPAYPQVAAYLLNQSFLI